MNNILQIFFVFFIFNFTILIFYKKLTRFVNIYDNPDNYRKLHKSKVPIAGGIIIFFNFLLFIFLNYLNYKYFSIKGFFIFFILPTIIFLIGLYDDKYKISANIRLFALSIIIYLFLIIDPNLIISELSFSFLKNKIYLNHSVGIFFTTLCILLYINALNMFDGINLQSITYILITVVFLFLNFSNLGYFLYLFPCFMLCFYLNLKNQLFLGDSGIYLCAIILSIVFINLYNKFLIKADQIFLLMFVPGIDMIRLFIERLLARKNPFNGDRNHFHHILLDILGYKNTILIILSFLLFPPLLIYLNISSILILSLVIFIYFSFILLFKRKLKKN